MFWVILHGTWNWVSIIFMDTISYLEISREFFDTLDTRRIREFCFLPREYYIFSTWKWTTDGLIGLSSHDDRMTECCRFEVMEILWYMPGYLPFFTYGTIVSHSSDRDVRDFFHMSVIARNEAIYVPIVLIIFFWVLNARNPIVWIGFFIFTSWVSVRIRARW